MMKLINRFSSISFNITEDVELFSGKKYVLTQIAPGNSHSFIDSYLSIYKNIHSSLGEYSATEEIIENVFRDDAIHRDTSIYLILKREGKLFATLKGTKRNTKPFRIESEFGFNVLRYMNLPSFNNLSIWHHSKGSLDKSQLLPDEQLKIRDFLKTIFYALYAKLYTDDCQLLLGEVNDLNYKSMQANNIKMKIVTKPLRTIGMPAYGIAINRENINYFLRSENFQRLFNNTLI